MPTAKDPNLQNNKYNPKDQTLVENGLLFPQYIDPIVRDNAGNVVKALKQQNLIQ